MFSLNCHGKLLLVEKPLVMGILNITADSFYAGSRVQNETSILARATQMIQEGADILDIGGQSTRPGSHRLSAREEGEKIRPVVSLIRKTFPDIPISIDTYHAEVAAGAVGAGASIVNDISSGEMDKNMVKKVGQSKVPYICMHMKGVPQSMQLETVYEDLLPELLTFFSHKISECKAAGIHDVLIDPGFGFGKNIQQNLFLLKNLSIFKIIGKPIMCGLSRKSTIYKTLHISPGEALNGTTVLNTLALQNGADILRVHDVKEAVETVKLFEAYKAAL